MFESSSIEFGNSLHASRKETYRKGPLPGAFWPMGAQMLDGLRALSGGTFEPLEDASLLPTDTMIAEPKAASPAWR